MKQIAIDGPAGAGKSSVAKRLAQKLGLLYLDTGAMYRTVAYLVAREGLDLSDEVALEQLLANLHIDFVDETGRAGVFANGEDVTAVIRSSQVAKDVSATSRVPLVRAYLTRWQRDLAEKYDIIMDGRDIGTVVLPQATLKVFLTASATVRAKRRFAEMMAKGQAVVYEDVLTDIMARDHADASRSLSPLVAADDAIILDTDALSLNEVIDVIYEMAKRKKI